jgi:hypothetical protein
LIETIVREVAKIGDELIRESQPPDTKRIN